LIAGFLACCGGAGHACADEIPASTDIAAWHPVDAETGTIADLPGLAALGAVFPDSGSVRLRLLNVQLREGDADGAIESLRWLERRGYVFGAAAKQQIPALVGESRADQAKALLLSAPAPIERSEEVATIPAAAGLTETAFVDPATGSMYVTSVTGKSIWASDKRGIWSGIAVHGADNLSGMVRDPVTGRLWVASGDIDQSGEMDSELTGLISILPFEAEWTKTEAPGATALSDLVAAEDGTIYASDPIGGGIYRSPPKGDVMEELVPPGRLRSPQGLAISADGRLLYASDYRYGIAIVDLATSHVGRLRAEPPILLDGIDGLWRHGNELVAVQNGTSPMLIVALELSADGSSIVGCRILERAHSEWTKPLSGSIHRRALYYVANGQWDRFDKGERVPDKPVLPTYIRRLPLD